MSGETEVAGEGSGEAWCICREGHPARALWRRETVGQASGRLACAAFNVRRSTFGAQSSAPALTEENGAQLSTNTVLNICQLERHSCKSYRVYEFVSMFSRVH